MTFKDLKVGEAFWFAWSGYKGVKVSKRCYTMPATGTFRYTVGTVEVAVERRVA